MSSLRSIEALSLPEAAPAAIDGAAKPEFVDIDPRALLVDEAYQRNLSERSVRLIAKIVANWNWARFKPPVVVRVDGGFHIIDGQHTAIAAVTHGGIATLPVMIAVAPTIGDRARAFVGHNRDRLGVTPQQIFYAELAAGDEDAQMIKQVCDRAGVTILKFPPQRGVFKVGETQSIATIRGLTSKHGPMRTRVILQALVKAKCAPLGADMIKAGAELLYAKEYAGLFDEEGFSHVVRALGGVTPPEAIQLAAARKLPLWRALVIIIANRRGRGRSSNAA
jgi:hypothetical protein